MDGYNINYNVEYTYFCMTQNDKAFIYLYLSSGKS